MTKKKLIDFLEYVPDNFLIIFNWNRAELELTGEKEYNFGSCYLKLIEK